MTSHEPNRPPRRVDHHDVNLATRITEMTRAQFLRELQDPDLVQELAEIFDVTEGTTAERLAEVLDHL